MLAPVREGEKHGRASACQGERERRAAFVVRRRFEKKPKNSSIEIEVAFLSLFLFLSRSPSLSLSLSSSPQPTHARAHSHSHFTQEEEVRLVIEECHEHWGLMQQIFE